jgi:cytochrome c biogenesis protein CcdA
MKNDPDIIRWSQLKRILIHFLGWAFVYFIFGLGFGFTDKFFYTNTHGAEGWNIVWIWLVLSAICTPISLIKN